MKSLYTENYKILMKEIEEVTYTHKRKILLFHRLEELMLKCPCYPKLSTDSTYPYLLKFQWHFYRDGR